MISNIGDSSEDTILLKLRECLRCISDIIIHASQFIDQTQAVEREYPIGINSLQEGIRCCRFESRIGLPHFMYFVQ